jgi:hypothetical protein
MIKLYAKLNNLNKLRGIIMSGLWYYVQNKERLGPIDEQALVDLFKNSELDQETLVWTKGMDNWVKASSLAQFSVAVKVTPAWQLADYPDDARIFFVRIGMDRNIAPIDYGPFDKKMLKRLYSEKRINAKTLIFAKGSSDWIALAELGDFELFFNEAPPPIEASEKRKFERKPFVARLFITGNKELVEGICRDISVGGMQVLTAEFKGHPGQRISINVHPSNSDYHFVADGVVVRILDNQQGFSFRFDGLSDDAISAINNYLSEN